RKGISPSNSRLLETPRKRPERPAGANGPIRSESHTRPLRWNRTPQGRRPRLCPLPQGTVGAGRLSDKRRQPCTGNADRVLRLIASSAIGRLDLLDAPTGSAPPPHTTTP